MWEIVFEEGEMVSVCIASYNLSNVIQSVGEVTGDLICSFYIRLLGLLPSPPLSQCPSVLHSLSLFLK